MVGSARLWLVTIWAAGVSDHIWTIEEIIKLVN